jgi:hypothetical protein
MTVESPGPPPVPDQRFAPTRARYRTTHSPKNTKWQKEEDERVIQVMGGSERPNYATLAQLFPGKTGQQVAERWAKVLNPKLMKGSWTREEDEIIMDFVQKNGTKKWQKLCGLLPGRIGKQCRERWRNHLDPTINHAPWTSEEDEQLVQLHREYGNAWVKISSLMRNRSDNAVKNRWNATLRKIELGLPEPREEPATAPTHPPSSPFVALQAPVTWFSPVLSGVRFGKKPRTGAPTLEENRIELLKLMLD